MSKDERETIYNIENSLAERDNRFSQNDMFDEIELCLSRSCNKNCISCPHNNIEYIKENKQYTQFMSINIVKKIIDELKFFKYIGVIDIAGFGEPTLNPEFLEIMKIIADSNIKTRVVTNGVMFKNSEFLNKFKKIINNTNVECVISVYTVSDMLKFKKYNVGKLKEIFLEDSLEDNTNGQKNM